MGYHIGKEYTRKGYASEALKAFLEYMMTHKNLDKVYGICVWENYASQRVLEKCGFKKEYEGIGKYQGEDRDITKYVFEK